MEPTTRRTTMSRRGLLAGAAGAAGLLITAAPAAAGTGRDRTGARARLRDLELSLGVRIGAVGIHTGTGVTVGYRAGERFPLLSTFKALAGGAILDRARRRDPGLLERRVFWAAAEEVPYSPVTGGRGTTGMTVAELCHAAITRSDNTAGNMMLRQIGGPAGLTTFLRRLGDPVSRLDRWEVELNDWAPGERRDTTTPAFAARDLRALTVGRALVAEDRERLTGWLRASVTGAARIRAGLPATWVVGDKSGTSASYGAANDIGIAWPPSAAPLVLAIYTNRRQLDAPADSAAVAGAATILAEALGAL